MRSSQTTTFAWDALGRMTSEAGPLVTTVCQYDLAGRPTRMTWPDSFYVTYDYDLTGAVTAIRENGAASGAGVLATYAYDNLGRRTSLTRGNGVITSYGYDAASRLTTLTQDLTGTADDQTWTFTYNAANEILTRVYSPALGRFLQPDHIADGDGMDIYAYVEDNPINGRDPTGFDDDSTEVEGVTVTASKCRSGWTCGPLDAISRIFTPTITAKDDGRVRGGAFVTVDVRGQRKERKSCPAIVTAISRAGDDMQNYGIVFGLGGGVVTAVAPEAGVGEAAVGVGTGMYAVGSAMKNSVSITNLIFNNDNASGFALGKVNDFLLKDVPEGAGSGPCFSNAGQS